MKTRLLAALAVVALAAGALSLVGCQSTTAPKAETMEVWGYVASADKAQLEVAENQNGVNDITVKRVLAPTDAWIVVHADMDGAPGVRVGLAPIKRGESLDVKVPLENLTTPKVIVAIHADKGTPGEFDFDMMNKEMSADRPFFVGGKELAAVVTVREFGIKTDASRASIVASDQIEATATITVGHVTAPEDSWIAVHLDNDGKPGQRVGLKHVASGETTNAVVKLDPLPLTPTLIVALHADRGDPGLFNFDMDDTIHSIDQPFFIGGKELAVTVRVK
ncbi:MAG: hypothetical protein HGB10_11720 [Coriobacteriia bacterium]|nr:hypothetical protein [Coriobacteriia bacterium]